MFTLTEGMIADVTGRLLLSSLLVRRLTAPNGPVDVVIEFDPRLGEHHRPPRIEHRGDNLRVQLVDHRARAARIAAAPPPSRTTWSRRCVSRPVSPLPSALSVADREPLIYLDPGRQPGRHWRPTNTAGRPGVPTSTATSRTATRWPAACSPYGC